VLLIGQPPEFFQDPNICFVERKLLHRGVGDCFSQPRSIAFRRLGPSEEILLKAARRRPAATYVNLASILCDKEMCRTEDSDEPLYEDKNHLDLSGAHFVGKAFSETPSLVRLFDARGSSYASNHSLGD
jgi:SGNH domain (fused to AT3 domains)